MRGLLWTTVYASLVAGSVSPGGDDASAVRVAMLTYGPDETTSVCFSDEFIETVRFETSIDARRGFVPARLDDASVFEHPFSIMTGEGAFELSPMESEHLRAYLFAGGFVLASAGCSNAAWDASFREAITTAVPEHSLETITLDHELFSTIFTIASLDSKKAQEDIALEVLTINGRVALVYSPEGLNDTTNAGGDCCCCGSTEIGNARYVNANILAYALTR
ncbi:MAG: hypothetical protein Tsb0013_23310 [Phycisphaerales bacterium]